MAFGLFKKKEFADIIYMNGHIYTQDPDFPWASAVACKEGNVLAVGDFDGMSEITTQDTEIVDLKEKYMFPGFIEAHGTPVLKAFGEHYLSIDSQWDLEPVLDLLSDYVADCDKEIIFGYGFHEKILERFENGIEAHTVLDQIESARPVVLLGANGIHCWVNTLASQMIEAAAEEDGAEYLTTSYILSILNPLDYEEVETSVKEHIEEMADKGFTSFFNLCAPDYLSNLYMDTLFAAIGEGEGDIKQRFIGTTYVNRPFNPQLILHRMIAAKTNCIELNHLITADFLKVDIEENDQQGGFSQDALKTICMEAAERGFHIHVDAKDEVSYNKAADTFGFLREKGYRANTFVLASPYRSETCNEDVFLSSWPTDFQNESVYNHVSSVKEAVDALTIEAAERIGMQHQLGSIEKGKCADFTVFDENPFDWDLRRFAGMHADMTILDGNIVYDAEEAAEAEMCDILFSMQL